MKALSCVRGPPTLGKHFTLFYSDNKRKMLVEKWSNAEEKGALGALGAFPRKFLGPPSRTSENAPSKNRV